MRNVTRLIAAVLAVLFTVSALTLTAAPAIAEDNAPGCGNLPTCPTPPPPSCEGPGNDPTCTPRPTCDEASAETVGALQVRIDAANAQASRLAAKLDRKQATIERLREKLRQR